ncbi:hypothetical protein PMIN03_008013 [Paraphaeosphaeria minitans]
MSTAKSQTTISVTHENHPVYTDLLARPALTHRIIQFQLLVASHASHANRALFISAASKPPTTPVPPSNPEADTDKHAEPPAERNPHCTAVVLPPGESLLDISVPALIHLFLFRGGWRVILSLGLSTWRRFEKGFVAPMEAAKASVFAKGETYYYVAIIGTAAQHRGKGLAQRVSGELTERAQEEGKPVWLEASSLASRRVYRRCGFVDVGETTVLLGKGEVDGAGEAAEGEDAVGVSVFPMVWWPKGDPRKTME